MAFTVEQVLTIKKRSDEILQLDVEDRKQKIADGQDREDFKKYISSRIVNAYSSNCFLTATGFFVLTAMLNAEYHMGSITFTDFRNFYMQFIDLCPAMCYFGQKKKTPTFGDCVKTVTSTYQYETTGWLRIK